MRQHSFDPHAVTAAYMSAIAPARKAQEQGFRSVERFARFQYAVAGDCLESGLAQMSAAIGAKSAADLLASQSALTQKLGEKLRARTREFSELASEIQMALQQVTAAVVGSAALKKMS